MKFQKPDASGASIDGECYVADDDGVITVTNVDHKAQLMALGFTIIEDEQGQPVAPPAPIEPEAKTFDVDTATDDELRAHLVEVGLSAEKVEGLDHDGLVSLAKG